MLFRSPRAMQITSEEIHKKLAIYGKKYIETLDKGTVGSDLPEPGAAGNSPLFAEPKSKVIEAFKKHMINQGLSQYVPIYAYGHNNYAEYSELTIPHPMSGIRVKNGRAVDYIVVAKNLNKNNKGKNTNLFVEAEHVFFHVNLHNFVKNGQYNTDDYQPTWIVGNITAPSVGVIDEGENVLNY